MSSSNGITVSRLGARQERNNTVYKAVDSTDTALPFKIFGVLLKSLKIQFYFCFFNIILTILVYSVVRYKSSCCELPFKESSCLPIIVLPPTNHSTLAEEVDGFLAASRIKISNLQNAVEMPILTDRQKSLEATIKELEKLNEQHSENLAAFGAIKREDERREEFLNAVDNGYTVFALFAIFGIFFCIALMTGRLLDPSRLKISHLNRSKEVSAKENGNSQNSSRNCVRKGIPRSKISNLNKLEELSPKESGNSQIASIKKMKRQIPILYLTTLTCVIVHFSLIASFLAGQYYTGSCPIYGLPSVKREKTLGTGELSSFSDYHTFAGKLQSTLDSHLQELNKTMQSPNLDAREIGWKYESIAIEAVFQNHTNLKQHQVDRNATISGQINYPPIEVNPRMFLEFSAVMNIVFIGIWAAQEGSIWQPWHFAKYYFLETYCF